MESDVFFSKVCWFLLVVTLVQPYYADASCNNSRCLYGSDYCGQHRGCLYGCQPGYSGEKCDRTCSSGCIECDWDGHHETCTLCEPGKYGSGCTQSCSKNCKISETKCDQFGRCRYGCNVGWRGDKCEEQDCDFENCLRCGVSYNNYIYCSVCTEGRFWNISSHSCVNCSNFCIGGSLACNTTTGACNNGCHVGYFGNNCDKRCIIRHCNECKENNYNFAVYCSSCESGYFTQSSVCDPCRGHCLNGESCDGTTGRCTNDCAPGWYGEQCNHECQITNCMQCIAKVETMPPTCKQCDAGFYWNGSHCRECSVHCKNGQLACNGTNGRCLHGCEFGYYGSRCNWECSPYCAGGGGCNESGHCVHGCKQGWYGLQCDRRCPTECTQCQVFIETGKCSDCFSGWYGTLCERPCSPYCKRNVYSNYLHCKKDTGTCVDGCIAGYFGGVCNLTCSEHCPLRECYRENGRCRFPCSEYRFGHYCEKTCPDNCRYQSANKKACNEITGMCVYGCRDGFYGDYCNKTCPLRCENGQCDRVSGVCTNCLPTFYGTSCNNTCPVNCKSGRCNNLDGSCTEGCINKMFGKYCTSSCSPECLGDTCFHQNGFCDKGCVMGRYGFECQQRCNANCLDFVCDQMSGRCSKGCGEGWTGDKCNEKCVAGRFGSNCDQKCGMCMSNAVCDYRSGTCPQGCAEGWAGAKCQLAPHNMESLKDKNEDTMAIAGSVTAALLLTVLTIVVVTIIVKRKHVALCAACPKPQKSNDSLESEEQPPEEGIPLLTFCPCHVQRVPAPDENTYGFQLENVSTALRTAEREFCKVDGQRNFVLDPESLQLYSEATFQEMPVDISLHTGKYKHRSVLIKCLNKERDKNQMRKFKNEIDILKCMEDGHINIFTLYGHCEDGKYEYSVFESCDRGDLKQHLKQLQYSSDDAPAVTFEHRARELMAHALDVLSGVIFLKGEKILHRLIIPVNVYLFSNGRAKIANFDFAMHSSLESPSEHIPRKYYPWLAVESRRRNRFSNESEIWTVGVLLLEIVSLGYCFPKEQNEFYLMPPKSCDRKLKNLMESCWRLTSASRPSCEEVYGRLKTIIQSWVCHLEDESVVMTTMV
ncbi:multiple epidermal growth factor-like domains protein 10 isoform X2 [Ostrea edulis]|uniref:multiple epidermal growth factor-like domains protein 10 isoform X2 n=1 Tax=Ostrea edulis TaxID=37623 RepID=UPI0024AF9289|nr:multiple epidermal growth factor-like domains protein 10 isoform X2 [Ostrea edulis]